jgi:tRNA-specific 2-thiouridylase
MRVAVLLSGGVDSSVALRLVQRDGRHDLTAYYLKIWLEDELAFLGHCPWEEDLRFARAVCDQAGVPLKVIALQSEYHERVVAHALAELRQGRTPSPDILCNQWIKFGLFFDRIHGAFDKVATGHYARIEAVDDRFRLRRSPDPVKDQTYFLSALNQDQLARLWFPVGQLNKGEVRRLAREWDLPNRDRRDSQGICFLGKIKYPDFVRYHLGEKSGDIIELETGRKLAEHRGVWFHTVGQRKGLRMGGGPWYVVGKDLGQNRLYVSHAGHYRQHARGHFTAGPVHWISGEPVGYELLTKVRHGPRLERCHLEPAADGGWEVDLENKDTGIAAGQSAVFYDGEYCLGSGVIH